MVRAVVTPAVKYGNGCCVGLFLTLPEMMDAPMVPSVLVVPAVDDSLRLRWRCRAPAAEPCFQFL